MKIQSVDNDRQYVCVGCGKKVKSLFRVFKNGITKLTHCNWCGNIVDVYVEYDAVLVLLQLLLLKTQAFQHVLFNRNIENHLQLTLAYILADTYVKFSLLPQSQSPALYLCGNLLEEQFMSVFLIALLEMSAKDCGIVFLTFFIICLENIIFVFVVYILTKFYTLLRKDSKRTFSSFFKILVVSSYGKLFNMAAAIWGGHEMIFSVWMVKTFVVFSLAQAIKVTLKCRWVVAFLVVVIATIVSIITSNTVWFNIM